MSLFLVVIFMSGYVTGFQQAEDRLAVPVASFVLELPEPVVSSTEEIEPIPPLRIEPGENIDVDSADESGLAQLSAGSDTAIEIIHPESGGQKVISSAQTGAIGNARFSIQVGMFSRMNNAERRVNELISEQLDAYYDESLNARNESRYHVRFGYFSDHRSARQALKAYQQETGGSAYIINLQTTLASR